MAPVALRCARGGARRDPARARAATRAREEIVGLRDGQLVVRVKAPPTDGRANDALCRLIAAHVGLAPSNVAVRHGAGARDKLLELRGIDAAQLLRALGAWPGVRVARP